MKMHENEKHPLISRAWPLFRKWVADQSTPKNYCTGSSLHLKIKIKIDTSLVYIMQAASCLREGEYQGEYCRLIRVSVIIVGYVRFRLKLNLEVILESKAILFQKICSGHQNERIALGLCQPKFVKKLDCRFSITRNILIGSVTHVAETFVQQKIRPCQFAGSKVTLDRRFHVDY